MSAQTKRLTKKQRRILRQQGVLDEENNFSNNFTLSGSVKPITQNQKSAFESWKDDYNLFLYGSAGTGKTFLALYFALAEVMNPKTDYKKVYVIRSAVPSRNQGFLPGDQKQKDAVYEEAYSGLATELFDRGDAYQILKQRGIIDFKTTGFLRGVTLDNCIVVVDEIQNMNFQECDTVITRTGENAKIIFCGDLKQDDLTSKRFNEESGLKDFMRIIHNLQEFDMVEFFPEDIVRSGLVKSYIMEKERLGL